MTVPVEIVQTNGVFSASVVGRASLCAHAASRDLAIAAIRKEIRHAMTCGEIVMVDVDERDGPGEAMEHDYGETPEDFIRELYRQRQAQKEMDLAERDRVARI